MRIAALNESHLQAVVNIHLRAFPDFFLSTLGPRFLREFYRAFILESSVVAIVAEIESGEVCGIVVGTTAPHGFFRRLLYRRWWAFGIASIDAVRHSPTVLRRLLAAVSYRGDSQNSEDRLALLSSIAVDPNYQGRGVGTILVGEWLQQVKRTGSPGCYLITDALANASANHFYSKLGWKVGSQFLTKQGRSMTKYIFDFRSNPDPK
jgi:GNAT superfamily N-acetyltransferase